MSDNVRKISIALLALAGVWVAVYWLWDPGEGRISFSKRSQADSALARTPVRWEELPADPLPDLPVTEPTDERSESGAAPGVESGVESGSGLGAAGVDPAKANVDRGTQSRAARLVVGPDGKPIAVMPPEFAEYTVRAGDTLATISMRLYGTRAHAAAVGRANPFMDPNRLKSGRVIRVPKDPSNVQGRPMPKLDPRETPKQAAGDEAAGPAGTRTYTVKAGDTLSRIAQEQYGSSALGTFLFESNRSSLTSPDELKVGMKIQIPPRPTAGVGEVNRPR